VPLGQTGRSSCGLPGGEVDAGRGARYRARAGVAGARARDAPAGSQPRSGERATRSGALDPCRDALGAQPRRPGRARRAARSDATVRELILARLTGAEEMGAAAAVLNSRREALTGRGIAAR